MDGKEHMVEFDFLGKDSIRYYNKVSVPKQVIEIIFWLVLVSDCVL